MRNIYRIPSSRALSAVRALVVVAALALAGVATRTQTRADFVSHAVATPAVAQGQPATSPSTPYFPAQYELHAGEPQPHIEAF